MAPGLVKIVISYILIRERAHSLEYPALILCYLEITATLMPTKTAGEWLHFLCPPFQIKGPLGVS